MTIGVKPEVQRVERSHMIRVIVMMSKLFPIELINENCHCIIAIPCSYIDHFFFQGKKTPYKKACFRPVWVGQTS